MQNCICALVDMVVALHEPVLIIQAISHSLQVLTGPKINKNIYLQNSEKCCTWASGYMKQNLI